MKILLCLLISCLITSCCSPFNDAYPEEDLRKIKIIINGEAKELDAGAGYLWTSPTYNKAKTICFLIKNKGNSSGWSPHSIVKVTLSNVETVFKDGDLGEDTSILEITTASDDGERLLVRLHYVSRKEGGTTHYKTKPAILEVKSKEIKEIEL